MWCCKGTYFRVTLDLLLCATMGTVILASILGPIAPPYFRVSCHDPSIRLPYHQNTISDKVLITILMGLPFIMMTVLEWAVPPVSSGSSSLRQGLRRCCFYYVEYFTGMLFMFFINEVTKILSGEPRPSFWTSCSPNVTCEHVQQQYVSVTWKDCTNPLNMSPRKLVDAMKSFPSGHASTSVFTCIFMIVYIKQRLWNKGSKLIAPWLQLLWVTFTVFCCQSRLWDNQHHWWDVLAGGLLGAFGALITLQYLANWFVQEECSEMPGTPGSPNYIRQNKSTLPFSHTVNHVDNRVDDRELSDINSTP